MKMTRFSRGLPVIMALVALCVGGCLSRSQTPRFFSLSSTEQHQAMSRAESSTPNAVVGIGPVKIADYLDQSYLVTRTSDNQVMKAEYDRWAGSFKDEFVNALADNLGFLLSTNRIYLYPWRTSVPIDYQVVLDVVRCDGRLGESASLVVRWSVLGGPPEKKLLKMNRFSGREPVTGPDYAALVAAESRAVAKLSQEIAEAIQQVGRTSPKSAAALPD